MNKANQSDKQEEHDILKNNMNNLYPEQQRNSGIQVGVKYQKISQQGRNKVSQM